MTSRPTHGTAAGSAYLALRKKASEQDRSTAELLQLYALEGFLARLAVSPHRERFVLKGGALLAAFKARRPTRDVDLLALRVPDDPFAVRDLIVSVASTTLDDGLAFALDATTVETIRSEDVYPGIRVTLHATLATAKLVFHVDVNVGDPVWPGPADVRLPRILASEPLVVQGYPLPMVLAEKIMTAVERGAATSRWRDFADVLLLTRQNPIDGEALHGALAAVATHRARTRILLEYALADLAEVGRHRWRRWRRAQRLEDRIPEAFTDVLDEVSAFADPALAGQVQSMVWNPTGRAWEPKR
ncbi:nucleotidyl transferase AbiEii/AbiGii toxin family protein [Myxococcota bacterium]|nr:nucleotidyl transferase AbiEii/AbiGii toxin family protein [Myxococcota bacterium]